MLLWTSTEADFRMWTNAFKELIKGEYEKIYSRQSNKPYDVKKNSKNAFVTTIYKYL